jgi:hypothetical protein
MFSQGAGQGTAGKPGSLKRHSDVGPSEKNWGAKLLELRAIQLFISAKSQLLRVKLMQSSSGTND